MIRAYLTPGPIDVFFQNPLVSVLPRFLFGVAIYYIYAGFNKLIPRKEKIDQAVVKYSRDIFVLILVFGLSTLAHTLLVLTALYSFNFGTFGDQNILLFIWPILVSNGFIEILAAILVGAPIAWRVRAYFESEIAIES